MSALAPEVPALIVASVNYQLQPVVKFTGDNWAMFSAAFINYARQQGFYGMLCEKGNHEPNEHVERWRQKMGQATTALTSGWVSDYILGLFRYSNRENANVIWGRMHKHYSNVTDVRQMRLRERAEGCKQQENEQLMIWLSNLNTRVAELEATGFEADHTYRKSLVRHNSNNRYRPLIQQYV